MRKIGLYGGTFSPPHIGHVKAAEAFSALVNPETLLIMPAFIPPHKQTGDEASAFDRMEMCRIAFSGIESAEISDMEIARKGKSYTYLTLEALDSDEAEIYMLVGTDMFLTLDSWVNSERIFSLATICYVRREDDLENDAKIEEKRRLYESKYGAKILKVDCPALEISSTELRALIGAGSCEAEKYISPELLQFIRERGLYS